MGLMMERYHEMGDHVSELIILKVALKFCIQEQRLLRVGYGYLVLAGYF
jgi:hypothetical protein